MSQSTVLITGINGFIGAHVAHQFLQRGWSVKGTVRTAAKGSEFESLPTFKPFVAGGQLRCVVIEDVITGAYGDALQDVEVVCHVAGPFVLEGLTWEEVKSGFVDGVIRLLHQSALVPSVKAFVLASTGGSAIKAPFGTPLPQLKGQVFDEETWASVDEATVKMLKEDDMLRGFVYYLSAKTLAEKAALAMVERIQPSYSFASLLISAAWGPVIHLPSLEHLRSSQVATAIQYGMLFSGKGSPLPPTLVTAWVDVRDCAEAFVAAATKRANGRFWITAGDYDTDLFIKSARRQRPDLEAFIPFVDANAETPLDHGTYTIDNSRSRGELSLTYRYNLDTTVGDAIESYEAVGAGKPSKWWV